MEPNNEIILYQPDSTVSLEVRVENETVWLTQQQMSELFQATKQNISLHINNIFKEGELEQDSTVKYSLTVQKEGLRTVKRKIAYYNLDIIISVGYRVKSKRGTDFRIWATKTLKEYLLKGYVINDRVSRLEATVARHNEKIEMLINSSIPKSEGIFHEGQIFDAYSFICDLVREAHRRIILIDNYVDDRVLKTLDKRKEEVEATIYTNPRNSHIELEIARHNSQYAEIHLEFCSNVHDRFLIIDDTVYFIGGSIKDLGKKIVAFSRMHQSPAEILNRLR